MDITFVVIVIVAVLVVAAGIYVFDFRKRTGKFSRANKEITPEDILKSQSIGTQPETALIAEPVSTDEPEVAELSEKEESDTLEMEKPVPETGEKEPEPEPVPAVIETSSLNQDDKNKLLNAVWYRCENPYCNHTQFLDVHHIVPEGEGGTNKLDNLVVLCSLCHALADKKEIPAEVLKSWISERNERFKTNLNWQYN